jgi:hypothetical protein
MKATLSELKSKLEMLEKTLGIDISTNNKLSSDNNSQDESQNFEQRIKEIISIKPEDIVKINVGGKHFATKLETLLSVKDNLFFKMHHSKKFDMKKEIFIDRSPEYFPLVLDYLRYKKINLKKLSQDQLIEFKEEIIYYELLELEDFFNRISETITYVKMDLVNPYFDSNGRVGGDDPKSLLDTNLTTGICTNNNGSITLELSREVEFEQFEIGGYTGKSDWVYSIGYGSGGSIQVSLDKKSWKNVGTIPTGFGTTIVPGKLLSLSKAKYIKFEHTSWIGLGYFKIKTPSVL